MTSSVKYHSQAAPVPHMGWLEKSWTATANSTTSAAVPEAELGSCQSLAYHGEPPSDAGFPKTCHARGDRAECYHLASRYSRTR